MAPFITVCKRSCGKVMFLHLFVSHSVHRDGVYPGQIPSWAQKSRRQTPPSLPPADGHCSRLYASYWNAFLFILGSFWRGEHTEHQVERQVERQASRSHCIAWWCLKTHFGASQCIPMGSWRSAWWSVCSPLKMGGGAKSGLYVN